MTQGKTGGLKICQSAVRRSLERCFNALRKAVLVQLLVLLAACDSDSSGSPASVAELNACQLLTAAEVGRLMGEPVQKSDNTVQIGGTVSQCVHTLSEPRERLTLLVRHSAQGIPPLSPSQQAAKERSGDDPAGGEILAAAIEAGEEIEGLGSLAYAFELGGLQLWVFWDQNYFSTITVSGVDDPAAALKVATEAAQLVIQSTK